MLSIRWRDLPWDFQFFMDKVSIFFPNQVPNAVRSELLLNRGWSDSSELVALLEVRDPSLAPRASEHFIRPI